MNAPQKPNRNSAVASLEIKYPNPRLIAFYLPQFYPFPENNEWWGRGFTEWTNVTRAKPLFYGHYQPHLPSDFGFYDLRVRATRHDQIETAKLYGIDGFCYHYYWFSGKRLLEEPLEDMLSDPESDMPFCLCWANENWTRKWDGEESQILISQEYGPDDDINFIKSLIPYFSDERYIRIDGKPFLIVYRPQQIPDPQASASVWRDHCREIGLGEIHLCAALTHYNTDYEKLGFDSGVEFPPHNLEYNNMSDWLQFKSGFQGIVLDYLDVASFCLNKTHKSQRIHNTVFPNWDNTPRMGSRGLIVHGSSPPAYEAWLRQTITKTMNVNSGQEKFVFINAWNEWAEGCHLEPDQKHGNAYLEATLRAKSGDSEAVDLLNYSIDWPVLSKKRRFWRDIKRAFAYHFYDVKRKLKRQLVKIEILRKFVRWVRKLVN